MNMQNNTTIGSMDFGGGWRGTRWRMTAWASVVGLLLLVPLTAMQYTEEVNWTLFDFVFMGALLMSVGAVYEVAMRMTDSTAYRVAVGIAVVTTFLLVWINGAVGIIGDGPINLLYLGVIVTGIVGALIAKLEPLGLARALIAMAMVQLLVPVIALVIWKAGWQEALMDPNSPHAPFAPGIGPVFILNSVFAMALVASALLFRHSARRNVERSTT